MGPPKPALASILVHIQPNPSSISAQKKNYTVQGPSSIADVYSSNKCTRQAVPDEHSARQQTLCSSSMSMSMSIYLPKRVQIALPFLYPSLTATSSLPQVQRRYESTARRTTKRLRTKTDASFTPASSSHLNDHIILNPPSASPSPYHTPPAFLPPNDPRRTLLAQSYKAANPYQDESRRLPPLANKNMQKEKRYHLGPAEIEEIRTLRQSDPWKWTRKVLAEKFECSQFFVGMVGELVSPAGVQKKAEEQQKRAEVKDRWGKRKRIARDDRSRRRELWYRDQ